MEYQHHVQTSCSVISYHSPVAAATRGPAPHISIKTNLKLVATSPTAVAEDSRPVWSPSAIHCVNYCGRLQSIVVLSETMDTKNMQPDTAKTTVARITD